MLERAKSDTSDYDEFVEQDPTRRYFRYDEVLGKGAYKTVYKAFDEEEGIEVAWNKVKIDNDADLQRLHSEINLLKSLKHGNIMKLFTWWMVEEDKDDDKNNKKKTVVNMITELFTSGSLKQYRKKHTHVEVKAIKKWARQILNGLSYLHCQNPPIVHRDLKCDNVFINGFNGEVKIGDLGFALVMDKTTERTLIGTPEFIAPEMYHEEYYDEKVDVYSFGMCLLEMVTCEYPYKECRNSAQIYKKVVSGVKPASLNKVKDPQVKKFIEKCLVPTSVRLSAVELLKDPFLAAEDDDSKKDRRPLPMEIDTKNVSSWFSSSVLEMQRRTKSKELNLRAKRNSGSSNTIALTLSVCGCGGKKTIQFDFYVDSDTAISIAEEMIEQDLGLSDEDVSVVAEMIDYLVMKLVPRWIPSSCGSNGSCVTPISISTSGPRSSGDSAMESSVLSMNMSKSFSKSSVCSFQSELLRAELDCIEEHYQKQLLELLRMKNEAVRSAKKKLIALV